MKKKHIKNGFQKKFTDQFPLQKKDSSALRSYTLLENLKLCPKIQFSEK